MMDSRIEPPVLVLTVIAAGAAFLFSHFAFDWLTTAGGLTLLLILFAYDRQKQRTASQSLAFSSVCALSFTLAAGIGLQRLVNPADFAVWLPVTWACATLLGTAIDRYRAGGPTAATPGLHLGATAPAPPSTRGLGFSAPSSPVPDPAPAASGAPAEPPAPVTAIEYPATARSAEEPAPISAPQPAAASGYKPEEATIYVDVIGGGISFLRSVRAEHVTRDIYRIVDVMPDDEQWRYQPGQTVRCKKKKLSSGKALVAYQEIVLQRVS